ncbi:methyltransferase domain-containing protein, partial [Rothia aeria]|uniref:methyltransferase domain-containing protein n=1 Tax=Rothia aeria TaxID=172042 RepID=UPI003C7A1DB5
MECAYYRESLCRSCTNIETPYPAQLAAKQADARRLLAAYPHLTWLEPVASDEAHFRNKAKLVVGGSAQNPSLGIVDYRSGRATDLSECSLYIEPIERAIPVLHELIQRADLTPYDIPARRGELKNILVTASETGELMVRFVLRSKKLLVPIRRQLGWLQERLPKLAVLSVNLLREHVALIEGDEEIILTDRQTLPMRVNGMSLHLRPQSFFQTNTQIAQAMYAQGREWVGQVQPRTLWDLYCGVGGFALHAAQVMHGEVTGIEISAEAIRSAQRTVAEQGLEGVKFAAGDATEFAVNAREIPEMLVVNPPRRGIGERLCAWVEG